MINLSKINKSIEPYINFSEYYEQAQKKNQKNIEAISISSFNKSKQEIESRLVNLKYVINNEWIFFSNYQSQKSKSFESHSQIAALFYWNSINVQIRIKGNIFKTNKEFSDKHFKNRLAGKNALAISSNQSEKINSFSDVKTNYKIALENNDKLFQRPDYWGGYSFIPYYFEFWEGHDLRLNQRKVFEIIDNKWIDYIIQP